MKYLYSNFKKIDKLLKGNVSIILDFIRGIAAILVVMEHLSSRLFVGFGNVENPDVFVQMLYMLNILGGPSVIIFFVLSGFFISRSIIKAVYEKRWSWKTYLINRLIRLYIVLIPALMITFLLDLMATNLFNYRGYSHFFDNMIDFFGNLFFLQNILVNVYGSNAPLWSLNYELWYYMLFPLLFVLFIKQSKVTKVVCLLLAVMIFFTIGGRMNSYFFIWLMGTSVFILPKINLLKHKLTPVLALFFVCLTMILRPLMMTGRLFSDGWTTDLFVIDFFVGISFGFLIYSLLHMTSDKFKRIDLKWFGKFSRLIASFSFSLYVIHYPLINLVYRWGAKNGFSGLQPGLFSVSVEITLLILICMLAFYFSRITESKTTVLRNFTLLKINTISGRRRSRKVSEKLSQEGMSKTAKDIQ